jgi:hypothetical protein
VQYSEDTSVHGGGSDMVWASFVQLWMPCPFASPPAFLIFLFFYLRGSPQAGLESAGTVKQRLRNSRITSLRLNELEKKRNKEIKYYTILLERRLTLGLFILSVEIFGTLPAVSLSYSGSTSVLMKETMQYFGERMSGHYE